MLNSAKVLAQAIREGTVTVTEATQTCFARIERHNPVINAVVTLNKEAALNAAKTADAHLKHGGDIPPLFGVPVTVKDAFETQGIRTTSSHSPLKDYIPTTDATVVTRLKNAGAIVLGKTNLPELAGDIQCWSPLFGRTNNPWNPWLTSGGSSGGSAAAVAMNFSYVDVGSDLAGSIRIPAAYCGVAGLKATENRVPRTGHIPHLPDTERSVRHLLSFGVLARCVDDLRLGFECIAGADGIDTEVPPLPVSAANPTKTRPLRVAWWDDFAGVPICSRTRVGFDRAVQRLSHAGLTVERCCPKNFDFEGAWHAFGIIMGTEVGLHMPVMERLPLSLVGRHLPKSQRLVRAFASGLSFNWRRYNEALNIRERLIFQLEQFLDSWDVWLCPATPGVAFPHQNPRKFGQPPTIMVDDQPLSYLDGTMSMVAPFSLTGSPVVTLPIGVVRGLPVGVQVVGKRWRDEALLDCCTVIESATGGFQSPSSYL
ncbi:MAG: amidase [Casimicrobium sp.]